MQLQFNCIANASRRGAPEGVPPRNGNQGLLNVRIHCKGQLIIKHQYISQDSQKKRDFEEAILQMVPYNLYRTALSADHGEVGLMALRRWDVKDRDPAKELNDIRALMEELTNLFLNGRILCAARAETPMGETAQNSFADTA